MYVIISLRLTFGGGNGPAKWITIDKPIADLVNDLLLGYTWEPQETQSPNQDSIPPSSSQEISIPFAQSKPLEVDIPVSPQVKIDNYLDDCIAVISHIGNNRSRGHTAMILAIHPISRPLSQKEPVPRDKMIDPSKTKSEGAL